MVQDEKFMTMALEEANLASSKDEVPVGAVLVQTRDPETGASLEAPVVLAKAHNNRESQRNPVGHAELLAIEEAAAKLDRWRLSGCTLYVTLEPCLMCAGAIVLARLDRIVYGTPDPKAGAVQSLYQVLSDGRLNHRPAVEAGILAEDCSKLLKSFFGKKRNQKI